MADVKKTTRKIPKFLKPFAGSAAVSTSAATASSSANSAAGGSVRTKDRFQKYASTQNLFSRDDSLGAALLGANGDHVSTGPGIIILVDKGAKNMEQV